MSASDPKRTSAEARKSGRTQLVSGTPGLSCCWVAGHGTYRALITVRPAGHVVGHEGAALPHRPWRTFGSVFCRLQLKLGINLGAKQDDVERDVEPEQQNDDGAKRPIEPIVVGEVRYVEREGRRSDQPNRHGEKRADAHPVPFGAAAARAIAVEERE